MTTAIQEAHRALLANQQDYNAAIRALRAKNGDPIWQHYAMCRLNQVRPRYRRAAWALHRVLHGAGKTRVAPPPRYAIFTRAPWRIYYPNTKNEAETELRALGLGRNEARRLLRAAEKAGSCGDGIIRVTHQ